MKQVYLIRHAQPAFPGGIRMCLGVTDLPLSPEGLAQARAAAALVPAVSAVFSSPRIRARQTAEAICPEITVLEGLAELDYGAWDGLTFPEIRQKYPELYASRGENPRLMPPGAEPEAQGVVRFRAALIHAAEASTGDFAAVSHGGILCSFLASLGLPRHKPGYCEIIPLVWDNGRFIPAEPSKF